MAAIKSLSLRHALRSSEPCFRHVQRRWATVQDMRFFATHATTDKYTEKYRAKLEQKAKEVGAKDINELKKVVLDKAKSEKKPISTSPFPPPPPAPRIPSETPTSSPTAPSQPSYSPTSGVGSTPGIKTLSSYLDIPKTLDLPQCEIEAIWRLRHASSPRTLIATIPHSTYRTIEAMAKKHPQFILPLPKRPVDPEKPDEEAPGAEIHFLQWTFPAPDTVTVLFTHLAEYKLRGEYAQPHTTVTHHLELAGPKGLVLVRGEVLEGRGVSVEEGRFLLHGVQKFYGGGEKSEQAIRSELLRQFSQGDPGFKVEALLEEAEKII